MSLKPICVRCQRFYRPRKNGVRFVEGMPINPQAPPGTTAPDQWRPYKVWVGDLWGCDGCGHLLISGVGREPLAIQHQSEQMATAIASVHSLGGWAPTGAPVPYQVNDC